MAHQALIIATWICTAMLGLTLALPVAAIWINPWDHHLSLTSRFHVGVRGPGWNTRLVFFNDADYGPYRGSIIGVVDDQGNTYPPLERAVYFGDTAGVYYRYFRWTDSSLWTLMVLIWYPAALFAILPAWSWFRRVRRHLTNRGS
jgi:hypothetical protein